ncbi:MAG: hypothetical protein IRZ31_07865 [Thermogemmatispora sp.]|uniref:hypothetical protein n=1 Tax=Thermogemmatispora sp. TaxID=1968838 RepID=UPI002632B73E|nr:hypothetical protein [Thermogemmatispora sp.]MBX5456801.1 hypothetical protein [Thermogemmatispora sp.]
MSKQKMMREIDAPLLVSPLEATWIRLVQLGSLTSERLRLALTAVASVDLALASALQQSDPQLIALGQSIEEEIGRWLAVSGEELAQSESQRRYLCSLPLLVSTLLQLAEETRELARLLRWLQFSNPAPLAVSRAQGGPNSSAASALLVATLFERLTVFGQQASALTAASVGALARRDTQEAQRLWRRQRYFRCHLARLQHDLLTSLTTPDQGVRPLESGHEASQRWLMLLWSFASSLRDISLHGSMLCERLVYLVEGLHDIRALQRVERQLQICCPPEQRQ